MTKTKDIKNSETPNHIASMKSHHPIVYYLIEKQIIYVDIDIK